MEIITVPTIDQWLFDLWQNGEVTLEHVQAYYGDIKIRFIAFDENYLSACVCAESHLGIDWWEDIFGDSGC